MNDLKWLSLCNKFFVKHLKLIKVNIIQVSSCNFLKLSSIWNLHDEEVCGVYSHILWYLGVWLWNKTERIFNFLPLINSSVTTDWSVFITTNNSNHVIKHYQNVSFLFWILLFNTLLISFEYSLKGLVSLKKFSLTFCHFFMRYSYFGFCGSLTYKKILSMKS